MLIGNEERQRSFCALFLVQVFEGLAAAVYCIRISETYSPYILMGLFRMMLESFYTLLNSKVSERSVSSANRSSVLPVNKVPPPLSNSAIEDMVSVSGISSVGYSCHMVIFSCGLAESALSCMTGIKQLHKSILENLGTVYPTLFCQGGHPCRK